MNGREKGGNYPKYYTLQQISETTSNQFGKIDASIDKQRPRRITDSLTGHSGVNTVFPVAIFPPLYVKEEIWCNHDTN